MRSILYRGFAIDLRADRNVGVEATVHENPASASETRTPYRPQLYSISLPNKWFVKRFGLDQARTRTSHESVEAVLAACKKWIDERKNLELAIQRVTMHGSKE